MTASDETLDLPALRDLHQRGLRLANEGRPREAARVLMRVLRRLDAAPADDGSALVLARVLNTLASVEYHLAGFEAASARLDAAAEIIRSHRLTEAEVATRVQRGTLLLRAGRVDDALAEYDAGAALAAPAADRCSLLLNRAVAHMERGAVFAARADLRRCREEAHAAGLDRIELKAVHNLGFVEFMAGELPSALQLMDVAHVADPSVAPGTALLGKAEVLIEAGLLREADEVLDAAAGIFSRERLGVELAEAELERARCALAGGDFSAARRLSRAARDRFRRLGNERWRRSAELVRLQADLAAGRSARSIVPAARRLRDQLVADGLRLPARAAGLTAAQALLAAADAAGAAAEIGALGPARRQDPITGRMHWHYVRAAVEAAQQRRGPAVRQVRRALDELARYQASFGSIDLRTASAVHGRRLAELDLALALESGRPAAVFAAAERARAVSSRLPAVRPPDDPVAAGLLAELRQLLEYLRGAEHDRAAAEPLLLRRRDLERRIVARTWTVSGTGAVERPAPLAEVRAVLADQGRTMVMYLEAGDRLAAVTAGSRLRVHDLGPAAPVIESIRRARADLDVLAQSRLAAGLRAAVRASLSRNLGELDRRLLGPVGADGPLVIVTTGMLGRLPWGSLPSLGGRSLVIAPSASKWLSSSRAPTADRLRVCALAGPGLVRGGDEVAAVGAAWPAAGSGERGAATTAALTAAMATATVLHVAAHGVHQSENPLFSFLRMADGPVFAHELDRAGRAPEHVVLSACEVGLATVRPGDEALGFASVLLHLGTRSVVAGVARVGDEMAAATMATYHAMLATGVDSATALATALAELDSDVAPPFVNFGAAWAPDLETASSVA